MDAFFTGLGFGIEGVNWYRRTVEGTPSVTGDNIYRLFNETALHEFLLWLGSVLSVKTPEMRRVQIVAAMYATWTANGAEARRFWDMVSRGGVEFEDNHPATQLDSWLKAAKEKTLKDELKPAQFYQGCVYAWNAFREDKVLKDIRADTRKSWYEPHA